MIGAGSIWAKDLWGSYWSWDPVETWSLLSWLIYGVALHLRFTLRWGGRRLAWLLIFAVFDVSPQWSSPAMLVAAGPAGAMPFVLALQYDVPVAAIARTILISTVGSLVTVTAITQLV